jgi:Cu-Zn family superoxide dismutase
MALAQKKSKPNKENTMKKLVALLLSITVSTAFADVVVPMSSVSEKGVGANVGEVTISESKYGLIFTPSLQGLTPGTHGFHLHQNASCEPKEKDGKMIAAGSAGGHYDPAATNIHGAPWGDGHLGDLPPLYVEANGSSTQPVLAPRLKLSDLSGHALMIHAGGDNHSDHPAALGGGGTRVSCGIIK